MGPRDIPPSLYEFAFIPQYADRLTELAALAEQEDWSYQHSPAEGHLPVLHNYLRYTFARVAEEQKVAISSDDRYACFNTGLVTPNQEEIYALFNENHFPDRRNFWHIQGFYRKGQHELTKFPALPELAHYFEDPAKLVFDHRKELRVNVEHIVDENRLRFPEPYRSLDSYALQTFLKGAIDNAKQRVCRNYKTAVPQYYLGEIQLLLPLCLSAPGRADLAMVVVNFGDFYRASTCLTLDMAYNNARQLARPDRDWLTP
jgi:hypothetical protein